MPPERPDGVGSAAGRHGPPRSAASPAAGPRNALGVGAAIRDELTRLAEHALERRGCLALHLKHGVAWPPGATHFLRRTTRRAAERCLMCRRSQRREKAVGSGWSGQAQVGLTPELEL